MQMPQGMAVEGDNTSEMCNQGNDSNYQHNG
jgi:hypothetical protein